MPRKLSAQEAKKALQRFANPSSAAIVAGFFKSGPGEYGEGDVFIGVKVPQIRKVAGELKNLSLKECARLLGSRIHEERLLALVIIAERFKRGDSVARKNIFDVYLKNLRFVNNWDLVDLSAPYISGPHLFDKSRSCLHKLARSKNLWRRRVAILSTFYFVRQGDFGDTLKLAEILLQDEHDLIHKAVGWMLREVGKRNLKVEEKFLLRHYRKMPRTMLRYAIEKFPEKKRLDYLKGTA